MQQRLQFSQNVVLDSSGNGSIRFGPARPNEYWTINRITVSVSTAVREASAGTYRGTPSPGSLISPTVTGSTGDTDDALTEELQTGEFITVAWFGGDAGATATAGYFGTIDTAHGF